MLSKQRLMNQNIKVSYKELFDIKNLISFQVQILCDLVKQFYKMSDFIQFFF